MLVQPEQPIPEITTTQRILQYPIGFFEATIVAANIQYLIGHRLYATNGLIGYCYGFLKHLIDAALFNHLKKKLAERIEWNRINIENENVDPKLLYCFACGLFAIGIYCSLDPLSPNDPKVTIHDFNDVNFRLTTLFATIGFFLAQILKDLFHLKSPSRSLKTDLAPEQYLLQPIWDFVMACATCYALNGLTSSFAIGVIGISLVRDIFQHLSCQPDPFTNISHSNFFDFNFLGVSFAYLLFHLLTATLGGLTATHLKTDYFSQAIAGFLIYQSPKKIWQAFDSGLTVNRGYFGKAINFFTCGKYCKSRQPIPPAEMQLAQPVQPLPMEQHIQPIPLGEGQREEPSVSPHREQEGRRRSASFLSSAESSSPHEGRPSGGSPLSQNEGRMSIRSK